MYANSEPFDALLASFSSISAVSELRTNRVLRINKRRNAQSDKYTELSLTGIFLGCQFTENIRAQVSKLLYNSMIDDKSEIDYEMKIKEVIFARFDVIYETIKNITLPEKFNLVKFREYNNENIITQTELRNCFYDDDKGDMINYLRAVRGRTTMNRLVRNIYLPQITHTLKDNINVDQIKMKVYWNLNTSELPKTKWVITGNTRATNFYYYTAYQHGNVIHMREFENDEELLKYELYKLHSSFKSWALTGTTQKYTTFPATNFSSSSRLYDVMCALPPLSYFSLNLLTYENFKDDVDTSILNAEAQELGKVDYIRVSTQLQNSAPKFVLPSKFIETRAYTNVTGIEELTKIKRYVGEPTLGLEVEVLFEQKKLETKIPELNYSNEFSNAIYYEPLFTVVGEDTSQAEEEDDDDIVLNSDSFYSLRNSLKVKTTEHLYLRNFTWTTNLYMNINNLIRSALMGQIDMTLNEITVMEEEKLMSNNSTTKMLSITTTAIFEYMVDLEKETYADIIRTNLSIGFLGDVNDPIPLALKRISPYWKVRKWGLNSSSTVADIRTVQSTAETEVIISDIETITNEFRTNIKDYVKLLLPSRYAWFKINKLTGAMLNEIYTLITLETGTLSKEIAVFKTFGHNAYTTELFLRIRYVRNDIPIWPMGSGITINKAMGAPLINYEERDWLVKDKEDNRSNPGYICFVTSDPEKKRDLINHAATYSRSVETGKLLGEFVAFGIVTDQRKRMFSILISKSLGDVRLSFPSRPIRLSIPQAEIGNAIRMAIHEAVRVDLLYFPAARRLIELGGRSDEMASIITDDLMEYENVDISIVTQIMDAKPGRFYRRTQNDMFEWITTLIPREGDVITIIFTFPPATSTVDDPIVQKEMILDFLNMLEETYANTAQWRVYFTMYQINKNFYGQDIPGLQVDQDNDKVTFGSYKPSVTFEDDEIPGMRITPQESDLFHGTNRRGVIPPPEVLSSFQVYLKFIALFELSQGNA